METFDDEMLGKDLCAEDRAHVLAAYVHRYTINRVPRWASSNPGYYKPQFRDDTDWLANTAFKVRKNGRLDRRFHGCRSNPTWPLGKWGEKNPNPENPNYIGA